MIRNFKKNNCKISADLIYLSNDISLTRAGIPTTTPPPTSPIRIRAMSMNHRQQFNKFIVIKYIDTDLFQIQ